MGPEVEVEAEPDHTPPYSPRSNLAQIPTSQSRLQLLYKKLQLLHITRGFGE